MHEALHGIAELPSYIRLADKLLRTEERNELAGLVDVLVNIWKRRAKS